MEKNQRIPLQWLEEMEKAVNQMGLAHVALEAQVLILDQIVGFLLQTGQKPMPEQLAQFRSIAARQLKEKYPGISLVEEAPKPSLYIPNGKLH